MVQILPYVQSPLEQLNPYINQFAGAIGSGLGARARNKADQSILAQLQQGTASSPMDFATQWSKLSPEARKVYEPFLQSHLRMQEAQGKEEIKRETVQKEKAQRANALLSNVDKMKELLSYTGSTNVPFTKSFQAKPYGLNREGLQKREHFDELAASAASFFRDLETKGQLPQGLYQKVIEPRLPSSKLSERQNRGRLEGLIDLAKTYGGLEDEKANKEEKAIEKTPEKLTEGSSLEKLPSASDYPNAIFRKGAKRYMSDGKTWKEI